MIQFNSLSLQSKRVRFYLHDLETSSGLTKCLGNTREGSVVVLNAKLNVLPECFKVIEISFGQFILTGNPF